MTYSYNRKSLAHFAKESLFAIVNIVLSWTTKCQFSVFFPSGETEVRFWNNQINKYTHFLRDLRFFFILI